MVFKLFNKQKIPYYVQSRALPITCGVPEGSILGLLLFLHAVC